MSATPRQIKFLKDLFATATTAAEKLTPEQQARVATQVAPIEDTLVSVLKDEAVSFGDVSHALTVMKNVVAAIKALTPAPPMPVGLVRFNPQRVITNKFAKACNACDTKVAEGAGYAVLTRGGWITSCHTCAHTSPEDRAAQVQAANEEQRLIAQARQAAWEAERVARDDAKVLGNDLFVRAGVATQVNPSVHVAITSATGNNDLDFYTVKTTKDGVQVLRVLGGHADVPLSICEGVKVLERLACVEDVPAAMRTFGQELGFCGRCGRHLTDETSRAVGLGPDCAGMY